MPTKIRLQRRGKKGQAFYHIVIADGRAPRDGKFIDKIGIYNPLARPAEIDLDFNKALDWITKGATPTETVKAILAYKGVMFKNHLLKGVAKGAMTLEQAETKFQGWLQEKEMKIATKKKDYELGTKDLRKKALEEEKKKNEDKAAEIAKKLAKAAHAAASAHAPAVEEVAEVAVEEAVAEPVAEVAVEEVVAEPVAEVAVEEVVAEPVAEAAVEEAPVAEEPKQE
jgi:small subunit ribosomal protein S16